MTTNKITTMEESLNKILTAIIEAVKYMFGQRVFSGEQLTLSEVDGCYESRFDRTGTEASGGR